ncbi:MAG: ATP synthase F1 subunit epsilon [Myxococcales bacterium]|nr:ATP synthase F1 subunit epsilon [Myxococcales bacterium]
MRLSITTPRGSLIDTEVDEVIAPGSLGEFGILPGHIPFLSALRPGVLTYRTREGERVFAVSDGLLEVAQTPKGEQVLVLVAQATRSSGINREAAAGELAETEKQLTDWKGDFGGDHQALQLRRAWAEARVNAAARSASQA